jgi:hypothetical protein
MASKVLVVPNEYPKITKILKAYKSDNDPSHNHAPIQTEIMWIFFHHIKPIQSTTNIRG